MQYTVGYFFCLEDRALLCRKCDVSIHTANSHVSAHQRFLLTGVKVGLEATEPNVSSPKEMSSSKVKSSEKVSLSLRGNSMSKNGENNKVLSRQGGIGGASVTNLSFSGGSTNESMPEWPLDDIIGLNDFNNNYQFMEQGYSKADSGRLDDSDFSPTPQAADKCFDFDEYSGKVPESQWIVPEMPSPPTASGLFWPKSIQNLPSSNAVFVPDLYCSSPQDFHQYQPNNAISKRRRGY